MKRLGISGFLPCSHKGIVLRINCSITMRIFLLLAGIGVLVKKRNKKIGII
jgi:hypothetical protein